MATGDDLELGTNNTATSTTHLDAQVSSAPGLLVTNSASGTASNPVTGLEGHGGGANALGVGVRGVASGRRSVGVVGECSLGTGVKGTAGNGTAVLGDSNTGIGVSGSSSTNTGVRGWSNRGIGVSAHSDRNAGVSASGNWGVISDGRSIGLWGVGSDASGIGALGVGPAIGVWGASQSGLAGRFDGDVFVNGDFLATGAGKSAAVPLPDGSLCRLYSTESPESWFEDFGTQKLVSGRAEVTIDPKFVAVVRGEYHIFLTPYGDSNGLYVARRSRRGFSVREQGGGTTSLAFSYRIVARRKDIAGTRFEKVDRRLMKLLVPRRPKAGPRAQTRTERSGKESKRTR